MQVVTCVGIGFLLGAWHCAIASSPLPLACPGVRGPTDGQLSPLAWWVWRSPAPVAGLRELVSDRMFSGVLNTKDHLHIGGRRTDDE